MGHLAHQCGVVDLVLKPRQARHGPQRAADHEALDDRVGGQLEARCQHLDRLAQSQDHGAAAQRVALGDQRRQRFPAGAGQRCQLPPLGPEAEVVEALDRRQHGRVRTAGGHRAGRGNDLEQQLVAAFAGRFPQLADARLLFEPQVDGVVRVVVHEALDDLLARPVRQGRADRACAVETQRPRPGQLDRTAHPPAAAGGGTQRVGAQRPAVDQHADLALQRVAVLHLHRRLHQQLLERRNACVAGASLACQVEKLAAVVEGDHVQLGPLRPCGGDPVKVRQLRVGIDLRVAAAAEPVRQLGRCRHRGCAGMARHHDGAAGVRQLGRFDEVLAGQEARHQPGREGVARAQHVHHLDPLAAHRQRVVDALWHGAGNVGAAHRAELDDQRRRRHLAHPPQRGDQIARHAAGDGEFFLGADQQVELRQHLLQLGRHRFVGDVAVLAGAAAGQAPQHRAVVDVEHTRHAVPGGKAKRGL